MNLQSKIDGIKTTVNRVLFLGDEWGHVQAEFSNWKRREKKLNVKLDDLEVHQIVELMHMCSIEVEKWISSVDKYAEDRASIEAKHSKEKEPKNCGLFVL